MISEDGTLPLLHLLLPRIERIFGLYELVLMVGLTGVIYALRNRRTMPGLQIAVPMIAYGVVRFGLDFLRVADKRYGGFTPGQYGSLLLLVGGVSLLTYGWLRRDRSLRAL